MAPAGLPQDAPASPAHFRALPPWARHVRWLTVVLTASPWVLINVLRYLPAWGMATVAALYAVIILPTVLPQRVEVGHDGVFLKWLGNRRFIPFAKIESVIPTRLGATLLFHSGRRVEILLTLKDGTADAQVNALTARIEEGIGMLRGLSRADEEAVLARGERDLATWMRDMRSLGTGEVAGYRAAAIPRERLWDVVENPSADPSAREGAALALAALLDDADRARLAGVALRTASPRVRIALDGAARERDESRLRMAIETAEREAEVEEPPSQSFRAARAVGQRKG